ncbi:MAG: hypothetical protein JWO38_2349 [Gemmataceae bacterium]|nr:hypothetical protein [Gemmataceae bacterium]
MRVVLAVALAVGVVGCGGAEPRREPAAAPKTTESSSRGPSETEKAQAKRVQDLEDELGSLRKEVADLKTNRTQNDNTQPPPPQPKPEPTFERAWADAKTILDQMVADEPEKTAKAKKLLTEAELTEAEIYLRLLGKAKLSAFTTAMNKLSSLGFRHCVQVASAKSARNSQTFLTVIKGIWHPGITGSDLAMAAAKWELIEEVAQSFIVETINSGTKAGISAETRDALLDLGGAEWLANH